MSITLPSTKSAKFEEINGGSLVAITDTQNPRVAPREATVLVSHAEYGPQGLPALLVSWSQGDPEPSLVTGSGRYSVRVIDEVARPAVDIPPAGASRLEVREKNAIGIQFTGGGESASKIIRWAQGVAAVRYFQQSGTDEEHLVVYTHAGEQAARIGDTVVRTGDSFGVYGPNELAERFQATGTADGMTP